MQTKSDCGTSLYLNSLAIFFSLVWLLPNHAAPWAAFHQDTLCALVLLVAAGIIYLKNQIRRADLHGLTITVLFCSVIPMLQYASGQILWFGTAWINTAYLFGAGCTVALGANWAKITPNGCSDFCFTAITLSGFLSVIVAICHWLGITVSDIWLMGVRDRSYANLGQPNQLASLYLLALLGAIWFNTRGMICMGITIILCILLLFGLALTGSRTGYANAGLIASALVWWSYKKKDKRWRHFACFLFICLFSTVIFIPVARDFLYLSKSFDWTQKTVLNGRFEVWSLMLGAASKNLLWGYGWGQAEVASLSSAIDHVRLDSVTGHSHNLFIDLIIWNGLPAGLILIVGLLIGGLWFIKKISTISHLLLVLFLVVLFVHAMTEYPLHYAYFLLPACLVCGVLLNQFSANIRFVVSRRQMVGLTLTALIMFSVTVRDYLTFESDFTKLRFEKKGLLLAQPGEMPNLWVLTDLKAALVMGRTIPQKNMLDEDLRLMENTTLVFASTNNIYTLAVAYELNGRAIDAERWLAIGCKTSTPEVCRVLRDTWAREPRLRD